MTADVLSRRALNRATLARQLLLERAERSPLDAVEHLVGMQAQVPHNPYLGLWSRLAGFEPDSLSTLLTGRQVVRIVAMRGTVHLVTATDALTLRPLCQPVLEGEMARHPQYAEVLASIDVDEVVNVARPLLSERPRGARELRRLLGARFPDVDPGALVLACRNRLALVQVPPRGLWRRGGEVTTTTAETWLGRPLVERPSIDDVVVRYLAAFGPATTADIAAWCRLTGFREVVERIRPRIRSWRDERGRELLDVPDGLIVDPDVPAPTRFLPEYDNVLLSHADRSRFQHADAASLATAGPVHGTVLDDGEVVATWNLTRDADTGTSTMTVCHLTLPARRQRAISAEAERALRFLEPDASARRVVLVPASR
ncbi:MAG: winged helix DNA-binding domain-containing protein [Ilumatobacteraceae bacterium]